jgi:hypothetical protein
MSAQTVSCWSCGNTWEFSPPLGRGELCGKCRRDAKCCLNCKYYDRYAGRECLESQAEVVKDKERSNFCDWFDAKSGNHSGGQAAPANPLDALFGGADKPRQKSALEEEMEAFLRKK